MFWTLSEPSFLDILIKSEFSERRFLTIPQIGPTYCGLWYSQEIWELYEFWWQFKTSSCHNNVNTPLQQSNDIANFSKFVQQVRLSPIIAEWMVQFRSQLHEVYMIFGKFSRNSELSGFRFLTIKRYHRATVPCSVFKKDECFRNYRRRFKHLGTMM